MRGRRRAILRDHERPPADVRFHDAHTVLDPALRERRAPVTGFWADGEHTETRFASLDRRIDHLSRDVRLTDMGDLLRNLPHASVETLQETLADGRITAWEPEHFGLVLERDGIFSVSAAQKQRVRALIDGWFARDAGAAR